MRQRNRGRHQIVVFIAGVTEHHALIARAAGVYAQGNVTGLLVNAGDHCAGIAVEAVESVVVSDRLHRAAHYALKIHVGFGGDFSGDHDQARGGQSFAGDAAHIVLGQAGIENGIGNLVGNLIGMAFGYRFGRK